MADMKWVRDIEDEMLVKECDCPWCMHVRQLAAAVRLAEKEFERVTHTGMHLAARNIAEKARDRLRSGEVEEGQPSVAGEPEILAEEAP